ncbi:MAG: nitronate monooxygenase [Vicinamibacterales bacterium]
MRHPGMNALVARLGLKYPIVQAPTAMVAGADVAMAVSEAGGLGAVGLTWTPPDAAHAVVSRMTHATSRAFVVNYVLTFDPVSLPAALDAGAPIVQFSWGMPGRELVTAVRSRGAKLGIQVTSANGAREALDLGADYLVCQGTEAGGHVQGHRPLLDALRGVLAEAGGTPVVASGGIGNGVAIRRVLDAGASAAMLGTRFVATVESMAHATYKGALVDADADDTVLTVCFDGGWTNAPHRVLRNATFTRWETDGCPPAGRRPGEGDVVAIVAPDRQVMRYSMSAPSAATEGDVGAMALYAGMSVDAIRDLPRAGELLERLWRECVSIEPRL